MNYTGDCLQIVKRIEIKEGLIDRPGGDLILV